MHQVAQPQAGVLPCTRIAPTRIEDFWITVSGLLYTMQLRYKGIIHFRCPLGLSRSN